MSKNLTGTRLALTCAMLCVATAASRADEKPAADVAGVMPAPMREQARASVQKALDFLAATQAANGSWDWNGRPDPAITALAGVCFANDPKYGSEHEITRRALAFVLSFAKTDGGIYLDHSGHNNYYTAVALMFLAAVDDPRASEAVTAAQAYLKKEQWDESEDIQMDNAWYGGAGYGHGKRPDLSNTQMMLEALKQSGLPTDDPVYKKALKFVERCQMSSGSNDQMFARGVSDGGFIYSPANDGESKAGTVVVTDRPVLRSYGSMTYAGFKSLLYADVDRGDPRVVAALNWIRSHWTLEHNPNMPGKQSHEGLYYYYHVFSRALHAWGEPIITDEQGKDHNWRVELCEKLSSVQRPDGSWINASRRWGEDNPYLVTAYSVMALQTALE